MCPRPIYSTDIRNAAAVAQGAKMSAKTVKALNKYRCDTGLKPMMVASTAPAPKISTGIYKGNTSIEIRTLLLRNPNVNAAPTDPIKLSTGVPRINVTINTTSV